MSERINALLDEIPSLSDVVDPERGRELCVAFGENLVKFELRRAISSWRDEIRSGQRSDPPTVEALLGLLGPRLERLTRPSSRRALNATGILLHTGLGRAPWSAEAASAVAGAAGYTPLQTSLETGKRSAREEAVERMLLSLTGCEAATVVNNNAAATLLALHALAAGREVIVSRGQLVEIGGEFRLPDVMALSGAVLREVGSTNRTHLRDYEGAIGQNTAAFLHVHTSNYRVRGFSGTPGVRDLAALARQRGLCVIDDLGSGALVPLSEWGVTDEPLVSDSVAAGSDVVCFSGDKLICGPQSGILLGRRAAIDRIRRSPYARMFRVCKMTLAGLEGTLLHFLRGDYRTAIPFYRMLARPVEELRLQAQRLQERLRGFPGVEASCRPDVAYVGSGSIPDEGIPSWVLRLKGKDSADGLAARLRMATPPVFARVQEDAVAFDMRTLSPEEADEIGALLVRMLA